MIEVIVIENIDYILRRLETGGYNNEFWTTRDIRRRTGLRYQFLYMMECRGVINPIERNQSRRLIWTPDEVIDMLTRVKKYLSRRIGYYYE